MILDEYFVEILRKGGVCEEYLYLFLHTSIRVWFEEYLMEFFYYIIHY